MRVAATLLVTALATLAAAGEPPDPVHRRTLENGLEVLVRPVAAAPRTTLLLRFSFGEDADPPGRSGLAHLMEHLYVTAAARDLPSRTTEDWFAAHPFGANAQTLEDATVVAALFPREDLDAELADAAARLADLRVTQADLERERPRLAAELENMYGALPEIAAGNLVRARLVPAAREGARRGGVAEQVASLTAEECTAVLRARYVPRNARLVLVGNVDPEAALARITELFGAIPGGEARPPTPLAPTPVPPDALRGAVETVATEFARPGAAVACVGCPMPVPGDADFPAALLAVTRLWQFASGPGGAAAGIAVDWGALEEPRVLLLRSPVAEGETPEQAARRVESTLERVVAPPLLKGEGALAAVQLGVLLGTYPAPEPALATNTYGLALRLALWDGLHDPGRIGAALRAVDAAAYARVAKALVRRRTAVVVRPAR